MTEKEVVRARRLRDLFMNEEAWKELVAMELELKERVDNDRMRLVPFDTTENGRFRLPMEEYGAEHLYRKGKSDIFIELWNMRSTLLARLEEFEKEDKAQFEEEQKPKIKWWR